MGDNYMENRIKKILENFEVPFNPDDWSLMEKRLDTDVPTAMDELVKQQLDRFEVPLDLTAWTRLQSDLDDLDEPFDELAKTALDDYNAPANLADWAAFSALLDTEMPNHLDNFAKTQLENFEVPFEKSDWQKMSQRLDDEGFSHEVDRTVKAALKEYESAQPAEWAKMASALEEADRVRRQLFITKTIEAFLVVFAIWTLGNFLPFNEAAVISNQNFGTETTKNATEDFTKKGTVTTKTTETATENENLQLERTFEPILPPTIVPKLKELNSSETDNNKPLAFSLEKENKREFEKEIKAEQLVSYENNKGRRFAPKTQENLPLANFLATKSFHVDASKTELDLNPLVLKEPSLRFRLSVNPEYAVISNRNGLLNDRKAVSGLSAGASIDMVLSPKTELSVGVSYNEKSYGRQQQQEFADSYHQLTLNSVNTVRLQVAQVPIHLNYNLIKSKKTRLYAMAGATAGLIMKVVNQSEGVYLANSVSNLTATDVTTDRNGAVAEATDKNTIQSISTNSFLTADLGAGLEYQLTPRFSIFLEPFVQQSLTKIGQEGDRYQNFALAVGSRVTL
jgi:hypothetical protein